MISRADKDVGALLRTGVVAALVLLCGCRSPQPRTAPMDNRAVRYSESGTEFFAEGETTEAIKAFRKAIYRSWATDDPYQAGTNAYNMAAVRFDSGDHAAALDWLVDARAELTRAGASAGNTYLLEAKIAQSEERFHDAEQWISLAHHATAPCDDGGADRCDCRACRAPLLACVPCLGTKLEEQDASEQCRDDYRVQVRLARARLATEQGDLASAKTHLAKAIELAEQVCSRDLRAEIHHAAAMIDLANGHLLHAAAQLDHEARLLRQAGNYRRIPEVLGLAASTYQQSERFDLAADRLCRVARIWFARGDLEKSWEVLQKALECCQPELSPSTSVRLKLTALEIEAAATKDNGDGDSQSQESELRLNVED